MGPAKQSSKIGQCLRKDALLVAEARYVRVEVALAQLLPVHINEQRHMAILRWFPVQGMIECDMKRRRGHPLGAPDDMSDVHQLVVDDVGEVVGGKVV